MTSGWPQDQRDLRWPAVDYDDAGPTARTRGRVATEPGPGSVTPSDGTEFGSAHPSGPLPVGPMPRPGRLGRGKWRDTGHSPDDPAGDADYDWIRYLGEAGPAQNSPPRASASAGTVAARPPAVRSSPPAASSLAPPVTRPSVDPALPARAERGSGQHAQPGARPPQAEPGSGRWQAERGWPETSRPPAVSSPPARESLEDSLSGSGAVRTGPVRTSAPGQHRAAGPASRLSRPAARPEDDAAERPGRAGIKRDDGTGPRPARSPAVRAFRLDGKRRADASVAPSAEAEAAPAARLARTSVAVLDRAGALDSTQAPARTATPARRARRGSATRKRRTPVPLIAIGIAVAAVGAAAVVITHPSLLRPGGPQHTIGAPAKLLSYTQAPELAQGMGLTALRADIVRKGNGEASHVVDAVYEDNTQTGSTSNPLIILYIGGNLRGSASSFISSFTGMMPGAFVTSAGSMGGQAACIPGTAGRPAECAWADNDTFGLFASPALSASALGAQMRAMRPLVEHRKG